LEPARGLHSAQRHSHGNEWAICYRDVGHGPLPDEVSAVVYCRVSKVSARPGQLGCPRALRVGYRGILSPAASHGMFRSGRLQCGARAALHLNVRAHSGCQLQCGHDHPAWPGAICQPQRQARALPKFVRVARRRHDGASRAWGAGGEPQIERRSHGSRPCPSRRHLRFRLGLPLGAELPVGHTAIGTRAHTKPSEGHWQCTGPTGSVLVPLAVYWSHWQCTGPTGSVLVPLEFRVAGGPVAQ
jgi:hypothetical protein